MKRVLCALLALLILIPTAACGRPGAGNQEAGTSPPASVSPKEETPFRLTDDGEAVLDGFSGLAGSPVADPCRVFYEIFVGSFSDSDGDGCGDLRGIINRMDYLNCGDPASGIGLGVEGLWLTPIFLSPSYHKYDVSDYYTIDPSFGTMSDLEDLIALCHERDVTLILDLPLNHTGIAHPWFQAFLRAHQTGHTENEYYNFYSWHGPDDTGASGARYHQLEGCGDWVECNFDDGMPEQNFDEPAVRQAVLDVARFYLEKGVGGFRFDAAKYLFLGDGGRNMEFWPWFTEELRAIDPAVWTVAEVWSSDAETDLYYPALNCFDFTVSQAEGQIASAVKNGNVSRYCSYVEEYTSRVASLRDDAMLVPFIANHDTDRAAGFLSVSSGQMAMAANLLLLSPGAPFLYYGEEIGMKGSRGGSNTDANRRLGMLWGDGDTVQDPPGTTYEQENQANGTVLSQIGDPDSLLSYYKRLIRIRLAHPEIAHGTWTAVSFPDIKLAGAVSDWEGSRVCVLHNATARAVTIDLYGTPAAGFSVLSAVTGLKESSLDGTVLTVGPQTSVILR